MIRIRQELLEAFATKRVDAFVDELVAEAQSMSTGDMLRAMVLSGMEAAVAYGFHTPEGIRGFVLRIFALGTAYYEHVTIRDWIGETGLTEEARLEVVDAYADAIRATRETTTRPP